MHSIYIPGINIYSTVEHINIIIQGINKKYILIKKI
jgi:hypothetical protein